MQIKIISKNKTNKHIFFWTRQGLTLVLRISIKENQGLHSSHFEIGLLRLFLCLSILYLCYFILKMF